MSDDYDPGTRQIGSCQSCRTNSELRFFKGRNLCDSCIRGAQKENTIVKEKQQDNLEDSFPTHKGNYVCIGGRRYDLSHAPKTKCSHKVLDWLNSGPVQYSFCPQCGSQVHYERATIIEEGNKIPEDKEPVDSVHEGPRPRDADEGVAGLSGDNTSRKRKKKAKGKKKRDSVVDRVEAPRRDGFSDEATATLAIKIMRGGDEDVSSK